MFIGIIGGGDCDSELSGMAEEVGREIAGKGAVLVCGGLGGVMEAAARGAKREGGTTVGILPGTDEKEANPYIDIPIVTGLGHARNVLVVRSSEVLIAIGGRYGTLSEIAIALKLGKPVIGLRTWDIDQKIIRADSPREAAEKAVSLCLDT